MHMLVAYSKPRGKYGRYVFTVMIHFSEPTETTTIAVMRPEKQTQVHTNTVYSCDHCGRWASIVTHTKTQFTTYTPLQQAAHQKDGRLELFRYDNVEPDDIISVILRDSDLLMYQWTKITIDDWEKVSFSNYWRNPKRDQPWNDYILQRQRGWKSKNPYFEDPRSYTELERQEYFDALEGGQHKEAPMKDEILYEVMLLPWDTYTQEKTGDMRVEEDLINQTMNAEEITIKELLLEPNGQLAIEGEKLFIEGTLKRLP